MRPGKPVWFGSIGEKLVLGLPGHPFAALITARLFLAPLLAGLAGLEPRSALSWRSMSVAADMSANGPRTSLAPARSQAQGVLPFSVPWSADPARLATADLLIRRSPDAPAVSRGEVVDVLPL